MARFQATGRARTVPGAQRATRETASRSSFRAWHRHENGWRVSRHPTRADRAGSATSHARNCVTIVVSCLAPPGERLAGSRHPDSRPRNRYLGGMIEFGELATVGSVRRGLRRVAATRRRTRRRRANRRGAMARPRGRGARLLRAAVRRVRPDEALRRRAAPPGRARGARRAPRRAADRARHAILRRRAGDQAAARGAVRPAAVRAAGARVGAAARAHRGGDPEPHRGPRVGRRVHPPGAGRDRSPARPRLPRPARFPLPQPGAVRVGRPGRAVDRARAPSSATRSRPRRPAPSYCCPTAASCNSPPQRSWPKASASRSSRSARRTTS